MTCNENCIHYPVCKEKDYDFAQIDECSFYMEQKSERPHGECNKCRHYEGVHGVQGHAPCSFWGIGGVLSSDYCSRFEKEGEEVSKYEKPNKLKNFGNW